MLEIEPLPLDPIEADDNIEIIEDDGLEFEDEE